jgi:hypothetical protein
LLGEDWSGNLTHDGCKIYDKLVNARHQQCIQHIIRRAIGFAKNLSLGILDLIYRAFAICRAAGTGRMDVFESV